MSIVAENRVRLPLVWVLAWLLGACAPLPEKPEMKGEGHLQAPPATPRAIPSPVNDVPALAPPRPAPRVETFSLSVTDVPVRDLLFSLARDAKLNVDIHPGVEGRVTLNVVEQTLPQILKRITDQVALRYRLDGPNLKIVPDRPYLQTYRVDYVNMSRDNSSSVNVATQIATTGAAAVANSSGTTTAVSGGSNNSLTRVTSISNNRFWETLQNNIRAIIGEASETDEVSSVILNAESGLLTVRATSRQHDQIQRYIDRVMVNARRQVLIEATVVEVELNDEYQLGVDWSLLTEGSNGFSFTQSLLGNNLVDPPFSVLEFTNMDGTLGDITAAVRALQVFGDVKVLSSPKIMAINNQTALLKVVDNLVYFTLEADTVSGQTLVTTSFTSTVHTVPVGFVMSVTPQISREEQVILNVRPTISRVIGFVNDPNPALADAEVVSRIPQIQVREMESVLRVGSGQTAVLGGLIQDSIDLNDSGIPYLTRIPGLGRLFTYTDNKSKKSELVIFLRPQVTRNASIDGDLSDYRRYLPPARPAMGALAPSAQKDTGS
ncbi:MAG TPA: pilus (MSHA type) biogenesis protein MshL [Gammaproteobacteria bacterium]|nr:pilus (MSHA type) biogenesis protein MshL [Gammaproteobacteria bacterium]